MDLFWASFSNAHKRIQSGGWAREVTQADFAISEAVSGVNMRLGPGGVRELHWHQQAEWAVMTDGKCRITVLDGDGRAAVRDVKEGDLWYFPPGLPHSLQGIGSSGAEFTLVFDNGRASEFNTLMLTEWMAHTPPEILAQNFGMPERVFQNIPMDNLWIYQAKDPVPPLAEAQRAVASPLGEPEFEFTFSMGEMKANKVTKGGSVKIVDTRNFPISKTIAAALVTIKPGGLRELHWHPNADEWQYYIKGQARMTVFNTGPRAMTADFRARSWLCEEKLRPLCPEHRDRGSGLSGNLQGRPLSGGLAGAMAGLHSARTCCPAYQYGPFADPSVLEGPLGRVAGLNARRARQPPCPQTRAAGLIIPTIPKEHRPCRRRPRCPMRHRRFIPHRTIPRPGRHLGQITDRTGHAGHAGRE
jgi:oxalate decarboxylase family bicupin protein